MELADETSRYLAGRAWRKAAEAGEANRTVKSPSGCEQSATASLPLSFLPELARVAPRRFFLGGHDRKTHYRLGH